MKFFFLLCIFLPLVTTGQTYNSIYWPNNIATNAGPAVTVNNDTIFSATYMEGVPNTIVYRTFNRSGIVLDSNMINWGGANIFITFVTEKLIGLNNEEMVVIHPTWTNDFNDYLQFVKFNKSLDTLLTKKWQLQEATIIGPCDLISDSSGIIVVGAFTDSTRKYNLFIARFDNFLNPIWHQTISDFRGGIANQYSGFHPYRLKKSADAYYVVGRCFYPNVRVEGFVVKMDLQGNKIWDKRYRFQNKNVVISDVIVTEDSLIFGGSYLIAETGPQGGYSHLLVVSMDTAGTVLHEWPDPVNNYNRQLTSFIRTSDSNFVLSGYHYHTNIFAVYGILTKFSPNMQTLWRRTHYYGDVRQDESFLFRVSEWSQGTGIYNYISGERWLHVLMATFFLCIWRSSYLFVISFHCTACIDF